MKQKAKEIIVFAWVYEWEVTEMKSEFGSYGCVVRRTRSDQVVRVREGERERG